MPTEFSGSWAAPNDGMVSPKSLSASEDGGQAPSEPTSEEFARYLATYGVSSDLAVKETDFHHSAEARQRQSGQAESSASLASPPHKNLSVVAEEPAWEVLTAAEEALEADLGERVSQSGASSLYLPQVQALQRQSLEGQARGVASHPAAAQDTKVAAPLSPQGPNKAALRYAALLRLQRARSGEVANSEAAGTASGTGSTKSASQSRANVAGYGRQQSPSATRQPSQNLGAVQAVDRRAASPRPARSSRVDPQQHSWHERPESQQANQRKHGRIEGASAGPSSALFAEPSSQPAAVGQRDYVLNRLNSSQLMAAAEVDTGRARAGTDLPLNRLQLPRGSSVPYDWSDVSGQQSQHAQMPPPGYALGPNGYPVLQQELDSLADYPSQSPQPNSVSRPGHLDAPGYASVPTVQLGPNGYPRVQAAKSKTSRAAAGNAAEIDSSEGPQEFIPLAHGLGGEGSYGQRPGERLYRQDAKLKSRRAEKAAALRAEEEAAKLQELHEDAMLALRMKQEMRRLVHETQQADWQEQQALPRQLSPSVYGARANARVELLRARTPSPMGRNPRTHPSLGYEECTFRPATNPRRSLPSPAWGDSGSARQLHASGLRTASPSRATSPLPVAASAKSFTAGSTTSIGQRLRPKTPTLGSILTDNAAALGLRVEPEGPQLGQQLDFDEFLTRQRDFEAVRNAKVAEQQAAQKEIPERAACMSPGSRRILAQRPSLSHFMPMHVTLPRESKALRDISPFPFRPQILSKSAALPRRGDTARSNGDAMRHTLALERAKEDLYTVEAENCTFNPRLETSLYTSTRARTDLLTTTAASQELRAQREQLRFAQLEDMQARELQACTFSPRTLASSPAWVQRMAASHAANVAARAGTPKPAKPERFYSTMQHSSRVASAPALADGDILEDEDIRMVGLPPKYSEEVFQSLSFHEQASGPHGHVQREHLEQAFLVS
ncbi:hypothetical protein WJX73_009516 [Symbiochloris irregularis]|uniref:Uncharacterized protein n=1 Tax=Symbiochloris irregularis TaxID=706552 RepID=A0AAW1PVP7_9CHLO